MRPADGTGPAATPGAPPTRATAAAPAALLAAAPRVAPPAPARDGAPLVRLADVGVTLGGHAVLRDIDLTVRRGEIVTVLGPNGSGKTTLMRVIIGALAPSEGQVWRAPGLRLAYVPQRLAVDPTLPISAARFLNLPHRRPAAAVEAALDRAGLAGLGRRPLAALSGGQLQRLLLARALMGAPDLMILDEGAAGLDQPGVSAYYAHIEAVRAETGCAVLMVSHDLQIVMRASDHVICLNGHVCCEGTPESVSLSPAYRGLFGAFGGGMPEGGALALYRHHHDHTHADGTPCAGHDHGEDAA
ncbi:metal ABC transporter ATP-binding protein [Paracoccus sanguinis]|uniref:ATP-binding cassette domain-containing protein n=2 Tax=Paracoccus sanguinis TaxID=1545044 RepID=UPI00145248E9|nr:metal ABC transporter ATP-binding protein [Paracoccus sanguinis]QJD16352.1 metal ABC transporter ATP-binding protein [Paracoccus sanguinis]